MTDPRPADNLFGELGSFMEFGRLPFWLPKFAALPRGNKSPVMVLPEFLAGDSSTLVLRQFITQLGYRARGWRIGINNGDIMALMPKVMEAVTTLSDEFSKKVHLVGWSLGGVLAREAARENPTDVQQVITMGTPVIGGPKYTRVATFYERRGVDLDALEQLIQMRDMIPIQVPITSIYSKSDGIVAWEACVDNVNEHAVNVEVKGSHVGMGANPEVLCEIARRLAEH